MHAGKICPIRNVCQGLNASSTLTLSNVTSLRAERSIELT